MKIKTQKLANGNLKITFPTLENATCEVHGGRHVNSVENWRAYAPHGNTKGEVEFMLKNYEIQATEMLLVDEKNHPDQIKYRLVVYGNFGWRGAYCSTSTMRLTKIQFEKLTRGIKPLEYRNALCYVIA